MSRQSNQDYWASQEDARKGMIKQKENKLNERKPRVSRSKEKE